jgi:uroporphyrinogen decarboxylase
MKHRDRVAAALRHVEPDRCPLQVYFTPEFAELLRMDLAIPPECMVDDADGGSRYQLEIAVDQDLLLTAVGWHSEYGYPADRYLDEWGVGWVAQPYETPFGGGRYFEPVGHPLAVDAAVDKYVAPDPDRPELYREAERLMRDFGGEYWIVGATVRTIWETAWALRGFEQMLMDLKSDPELVNAILEIPFRYHLAVAEQLTRMGVDMIWTGDDIGTQTGMLFSPDLWRHFLKPRMAEFIARLKAINPEIKIAYHSDGDVRAVIPELIEIGVDVLHPVQPACMDLADLKTRYGDRLCFWGSVDSQFTLPFGSPDDVRKEVLSRLETVGIDGGLIIGPPRVQLDTPMENFWAMVRTVRETPYASFGRSA